MTNSNPPRGNPYAGLSDLTGDEPLPPLEDPTIPPATPPRSPLLTGLIVFFLLAAVMVGFFQILRDPSPDEPVAGAETTTTVTEDGDGTTSTTAGDTSGAESTTTTVGDTTASTVAAFSPYEPVGDPIPVSDLVMTTAGLGPIEFGQPADEAIGRLIASLGEPDADTGPVVSTGDWGVCEGDVERVVRWGPLAAIVAQVGDEEQFVGYRLDLSYGGLGSPATSLQTLSGLQAGDTVARLKDIYNGFEISFPSHPDLGDVFELRSARTGNLLLWGPVTSTDDDGIVLGIYAPDFCGRT